MEQSIRCGIDIAKIVFQIHGVNATSGETVMVKKIARHEMLRFFANKPPMLIGIEACGGAHYWARELTKLGHRVKLMTPQYVTPYRRGGKNDANDAEAICEALARPNMRFVAVKSESQQAVLVLHRMRKQHVRERTSLMNQIRSYLYEFGIVISQGRAALAKTFPLVAEQESLPMLFRQSIAHLADTLTDLEIRIDKLNKQIESWTKQDNTAKALLTLCGVGSVTASAAVAMAGDVSVFKNGRQFAAWLGLVPKQNSSGGKTILGAITKRGDRYLRTLLVQGARTVMLAASRAQKSTQSTPIFEWIYKLQERRPNNVVVVAIAAKQARMLWAIMAKQQRQYSLGLPT
jgi:transposase